jgi:hypothetical protein
VILELDGSLVFVEDIQPTFAAVVALPEQPTDVQNRFITPGRVGARKISPFSKFARAVNEGDLSAFNQTFLATFKQVRDENGPNKVIRTPEEEAAMSVTKAGPTPKVKKTKAETPHYAKKCQTCGEQPGHPNHPDGHAFVEPAAGFEKPEKTPRVKKEKAAKTPRAGKPGATGSFRFVGSDATLEMLGAMNPKYAEGNTGRHIITAIKDAGDDGIDLAGVQAAIVAMGKKEISVERLTLAFTQLQLAKMIEVVA